MNERIRELADKIWAEEYWTNPNTDKLLPAQLNKFAELIVKKCANIVWDEAEKTSNSDVNDAGYKIIEYFHGVEE